MKRKYINLEEKIEIFDYTAKHPELGCRKLDEHFFVENTAITNILKQGKTLRKDFGLFKGTKKKRRHGKYHILVQEMYEFKYLS